MTDPDRSALISRLEPRTRAWRSDPRYRPGRPIPYGYGGEIAWPGWAQSESLGGNPMMLRQVGPVSVALSWGPTAEHASCGWGPGVLWYVDLEGDTRPRGTWPFDPASHCCVHIERGYPSEALALGAVAWLRSCVEVAGEAGLWALNERTGGRLA